MKSCVSVIITYTHCHIIGTAGCFHGLLRIDTLTYGRNQELDLEFPKKTQSLENQQFSYKKKGKQSLLLFLFPIFFDF